MRLNTDRRTVADDLLAPVYAGVQRTAFWTAVVIPVVLLWLFGAGLAGWRLPAFGVLIALDVVALIVGHDHAPRSEK